MLASPLTLRENGTGIDIYDNLSNASESIDTDAAADSDVNRL